MRTPFKVGAVIVMALFALVVVSTIVAAGDRPDAANAGTPAGGAATGSASFIVDAIGKSNRGAPTRAAVSWNIGSDGENELVVRWAINENLTEGLTKDTARIEAAKILEAVRDSGISYDRVLLDGTYPLVDRYGNESEERVVLATYDRATVERINFDGVPTHGVFELSRTDWLFVHPAFRY